MSSLCYNKCIEHKETRFSRDKAMNFITKSINSLYNAFLSLPIWGRVLITVIAVAITLIGFVEGLEFFGLIEFTDLTPAAEAAEAVAVTASS